MRIFLALHPSANLSVPGSTIWLRNLYEPLIDLGHDVYLLRMDEIAKKFGVPFRGKKFCEVFSMELWNIYRSEHNKKPFDLFLSYLTDSDIEANVIKSIKSFGIPMANFSCNNTHQFHLIKKISPFFDFNLHSEKFAEDKFKAINASHVWFPMAANPKYYFPVQSPFLYDVTFIGSAYAKRIYYIWCLLEQNIDITCFGPNWQINKPNQTLKWGYKEIKRILDLVHAVFTDNPEKRYGLSTRISYYDLQVLIRSKFNKNLNYPVADDEMVKLFNQSKINLGFLEVYSKNNDTGGLLTHHLHLREFEVPMSGGLYMTSYSEELSEFYVPDKEILVFHNEFELTEKSKYYLLNATEAGQIRRKGYERSIGCHTYQKRFKDLFLKLGFKN
jgi:spore maturation protein CgeB